MQAFVNFLAAKAYAQVREQGGYTAIIEFSRVPADSGAPLVVRPQGSKSSPTDLVRVSCIGAGTFACDVIFPYLTGLPGYRGVSMESVATSSGVSAESARARFGFARTQTPAQLMQDPATDAVFVLSRNDSHARYVTEAIRQRKPVFVEKPLASNRHELAEVERAFNNELEQGESPFVMVGFNRRFAPLTGTLRHFFGGRREPMLVHIQ